MSDTDRLREALAAITDPDASWNLPPFDEMCFQGSDLQSIEAPGIRARKANFKGCDLREANLLFAQLDGSSFYGADLRGAYLTGARLHGTDLREAHLENVIMDFAHWDATTRWPETFEPPSWPDDAQQDDREPSSTASLDVGPNLLDLVTATEISHLEALLTLIERAQANSQLTEHQEQRIRTMAEIIERIRTEAISGPTERWKVVGPIRTALGYGAVGLPASIFAWDRAAAVLAKIQWTELARWASSLP